MRNRRHVALGTISFMVCFAALGVDCGLRTPLPRDLSPDGFADRIARCDSSAPRVSCPHPDGYSHRPFWWPCNLLYIDGGCGDSRVDCARTVHAAVPIAYWRAPLEFPSWCRNTSR
jgi:hypothetical protein